MNEPPQECTGRWFCRQGWLVYPKEGEPGVPVKGAKARYNDQPSWSLCQFEVESIERAAEILREFSKVSHDASQAFLWTTTYPSHDRTSGDLWKVNVHGWKHVSFADFDAKAFEVRGHLGKSLLRQTEFNLDRHELDLLIAGASKEQPAEVARLWYLCKSHAGVRKVVSRRWIHPNQVDELAANIPSAIDLGKRYLEAIFANPGKDSDSDREKLMELTKTGNILGIDTTGRSSTQYPWPDRTFIRAMAGSLVKQIRQARKLLKKTGLSDEGIASQSLEFLGIDDRFLSELLKPDAPVSQGRKLQDHELADKLAGQRLGIEPRSVKEAFNTKTRPQP